MCTPQTLIDIATGDEDPVSHSTVQVDDAGGVSAAQAMFQGGETDTQIIDEVPMGGVREREVGTKLVGANGRQTLRPL